MANASAQQPKGYAETAYVVANPGDTLWGKKVRANGGSYLKSIRMESVEGVKTTYKPENILAAGYIDSSNPSYGSYWREYEQITDPDNPSEFILAERLVDGNVIRLYSHPSGFGIPRPKLRNVGFSLGTFGSGINIDLGTGAPEPRYVIAKNGKPSAAITKSTFNRVYDALFTDCPAFVDVIRSTPSLRSFDNLEELINIYNEQCP